ncbi:MAG: hypothetical protein NC212_08465 [Staphylococcus sp.]|nr:hypothetical protein [Staphylococcus sp.]
MKTSYISLAYKDLAPVINISPSGGVGNTQNFNAATGEWAPDYSLSPLVLRPSVSVIDPDGRASGDVTTKLTDARWYEVAAGKETLITGTEAATEDSTKKKYTLGKAADGYTLQLNSNVAAGEKISLRFKAKYLDTRKNAVLVLSYDCVVKCLNETLTTPDLIVNFPESSTWDPIYETTATVKIKADLLLASGIVDASKRVFVWEMLRDDNTWSEVGSSILDNECSISADTSELTLDRSLMGTRCDLRVRAKYDPDGNPAGVVLNDLSPEKRISVVRQICEYWYNNVSPRSAAVDGKMVRLRCVIEGAKGNLPTPERELEFIWYVTSNPTNPSWSEVARGQNVDVSTSFVSEADGALTAVDVKDRGPLKYLKLSTGEYLTIGGKLLMVKHNSNS